MSEIDATISAVICGDGYVTKKGSICFSHTEKQKEYGEWKKMLLEKNGMKFIKTRRVDRITPYNGKPICVWSTSANQFGKYLRSFFYANDKKTIPTTVFDNWTPLQIAMLYQDDGRCNKISHYTSLINGLRVRKESTPWVNRYEFCKNNWDEITCKSFQNLLSKFEIESTLGKRNGNICISQKDSKLKFKKLIEDHIQPTMLYKIELRPCLTVRD